MIGTALLAMVMSLASPDPAALVAQSEQGFYASDFTRATEGLDVALARAGLDPDTRLLLLLQKLRVQQNARLAGVTVGDEADVRSQVVLLTATTRNQDLAGQVALRLTVSRYFTALLADDLAGSMAFVPAFEDAAARITARCRRAEALFFAALMPQVAGRVAESKAPLDVAGAASGEACALEQSYVDRHLAWVAQDAGDFAKARDYAMKSSEARRRIGFEIFLPFSLLLEADLEAKNGNVPRAQALLREATAMAARLKLPAALSASCEELAAQKLASEHCPG